MELGFETIGNATLICHDEKPVLVTDPWLQGSAYYGSWALSHEIPKAQFQAALQSEFVWLSHGHPDHMNPDSMPLFRKHKILLPDHVGGRIKNSLLAKGYDVVVLQDRKWYTLSDRIRILTIADPLQDAILLVDIGGKLIVNINDASLGAWRKFVRRCTRQYHDSFLLALCCFGDADMINCYTEDGKFIEPVFGLSEALGTQAANACAGLGTNHFIPFSSMHRYQREDSVWTNRFGLKLSDFETGFESTTAKLLPAYIQYDCRDAKHRKINPSETPVQPIPPSLFGDNWSDELDSDDVTTATTYFRTVEHLGESLDFINLRVGGKDHPISLSGKHVGRGLTFEAPRNSLMSAIRFQVFDDMLIGNFMKTTFHGKWDQYQMDPHFAPYLTKYADNGLAKKKAEVTAYLKEYEKRSLDNVIYSYEEKSRAFAAEHFNRDSALYKAGKKLYHGFRKITG